MLRPSSSRYLLLNMKEVKRGTLQSSLRGWVSNLFS